jgi:hypothetical protein
LGFDFGMRRGVGFVGFSVEVRFGLVIFVEFMLLDVDHSIFDRFFRFAMFVNMDILVERSKPTEGSDVIFLGVERGCFALGFSDLLGESGRFFFGEFVMRGVEMAGDRSGFRFGFEVSDFRLGIIASGEGFVRFVAGISFRFGSLGGGGPRMRRLFGMALSNGLFVSGLAFPFRDGFARQRLEACRG